MNAGDLQILVLVIAFVSSLLTIEVGSSKSLKKAAKTANKVLHPIQEGKRAMKRRQQRNARIAAAASGLGLLEALGRRFAGVPDEKTKQGQIDALRRQLAAVTKERDVLLHRVQDLRRETAAVAASPIHTDCTHQHCLDYKDLVEGMNKKASAAVNHRWSTKR